jgi:L,D-transpeptidase ErfK/SrfK
MENVNLNRRNRNITRDKRDMAGFKSLVIVFFILVVFFLTAGILSANPNFTGIREFSGKFGEYVVKYDENLYIIARNRGYAIEHLMFANGLPGISVPEGRKLIIPSRRIPPSARLNNGIVLNLPERGIYLYKNGSIEKFYPVAIGSPGQWMTPVGDTTIIVKAVNPTWFPPAWANREEPVLPGPENPLGDRWMGLGLPGYGIHATNNPSSIGLATSHGCIRMYPEMAHDLFERVHVGMPVKIVYEPVKIGYDPSDRMVYMEVYPDVYGKTSSLLNEANRKLAEHGISGIVEPSAVKWIVDRKRGIPEPILGSRIVVKIDGKVQNLNYSPLMINGRIWVTSDILEEIGTNSTWDGENKAIIITWGDKDVTLYTRDNITDGVEDSAYLWQGKSYIPLSYVLGRLGVEYTWYGKERVIYISSAQRLQRQKVIETKQPEEEKKTFIEEKPEVNDNEVMETDPTWELTPPAPSVIPED